MIIKSVLRDIDKRLLIKEILKYHKLTDKYDGVKKWYNGYIFGEQEVIYNLWIIINYVSLPKYGFMHIGLIQIKMK